MDISGRLKQLEDLVAEAKTVPLSSSVRLNRDEVLEVLESIRASLPEEIKQARWVVKDREELLAKARRDAEGLVEKGRAEALRLASREEVVRVAQEEAGRILGEARDEARQIRLEAEDYVDQQLAALEASLGKLREALTTTAENVGVVVERLDKTAQQIHAGREKLRGGLAAPGPADEGADGPEQEVS
jgi:vacuolar-type H+-ATPase subunit H